MSKPVFEFLIAAVGLFFFGFFCFGVLPPLLESGDLVGAILASFVNPYAAGFSTDTILCWVVLAIWVIYERGTLGIRHGWVALLLGLVPGVATGFALYLLLRLRQQAATNA